MAFKFYTPIETQADNVGFYNASIAKQQQEYERQKQIEAGLQHPNRKIAAYWVEEAKKEGMLPSDFAPRESIGSPLRTAQKYQSDIASLKEKSKGTSEKEFTQNAGESAYSANMKKAGLSLDPSGTGYMYKGQPVNAEQAYALMDQAAGRGNARIGEGGQMTDTGLAQSDAQKKMAIQESGDISKTGEITKLNQSLEKAGTEPIGFRGTVEAQLAKTQPKVSQEDVTAEISKRDEQKAIDTDAAAQKQQSDEFSKNVTVKDLWDQSGEMSFNTQQRYGAMAEWIDNNVKDPAKHEQMMRELMRMPEAQKYVGYRGADLGLDEGERLLAMKGRRGGASGGGKRQQLGYKYFTSDGKEVKVPMTLPPGIPDMAEYRSQNPNQYLKWLKKYVQNDETKNEHIETLIKNAPRGGYKPGDLDGDSILTNDIEGTVNRGLDTEDYSLTGNKQSFAQERLNYYIGKGGSFVNPDGTPTKLAMNAVAQDVKSKKFTDKSKGKKSDDDEY